MKKYMSSEATGDRAVRTLQEELVALRKRVRELETWRERVESIITSHEDRLAETESFCKEIEKDLDKEGYGSGEDEDSAYDEGFVVDDEDSLTFDEASQEEDMEIASQEEPPKKKKRIIVEEDDDDVVVIPIEPSKPSDNAQTKTTLVCDEDLDDGQKKMRANLLKFYASYNKK